MKVFTAENLFLNYYRDSEVIRDINNTEYTNDFQTSEIVEENKRRYKILEKEMIERGNPFFQCNKYTSIINFSEICFFNNAIYDNEVSNHKPNCRPKPRNR